MTAPAYRQPSKIRAIAAISKPKTHMSVQSSKKQIADLFLKSPQTGRPLEIISSLGQAGDFQTFTVATEEGDEAYRIAFKIKECQPPKSMRTDAEIEALADENLPDLLQRIANAIDGSGNGGWKGSDINRRFGIMPVDIPPGKRDGILFYSGNGWRVYPNWRTIWLDRFDNGYEVKKDRRRFYLK
jgi:hypothetical protein